MQQKQTVTKTITIVMDVDKDQQAKLEEQWQSFLMDEVTLETVMKWYKKWMVDISMR